MKAPGRSWWVWPTQIVLGGLFIAAGAIKLLDAPAFAASMASFRVLSRGWSNAVAIGLPPFEIVCGVMLILGPWRPAAAMGLGLLNAVFIVVLGQAMARGLSFDCGCFGKWDPWATQPGLAIGRDFFFLAAAALLYREAFVTAEAAKRAW
jgi:uncharacterized membrane protein YphA (DoxX/SURF4 family)